MQKIISPDASHPPSFTATLLYLLRHPLTIVRLWNWKSAVLSTVLRGPIFFVASFRLGLGAALWALGTELFFCAATSGFYGAIVQALRLAEPQWLTLLFVTLILPGIFQVFEYFLHWTGGTAHLRLAEIFSVTISGLSALFNWYVMRRGTLLVGPQGARFKNDLVQLPRLLLGFITALPRRWLAWRRGESAVGHDSKGSRSRRSSDHGDCTPPITIV